MMIRKAKGFTLVEIMITTGIISLLAAIAVPNFMETRRSAQRDACINNLRQIEQAKEQYVMFENIDETTNITDGNDLNDYLRSGYASVTCPTSGSYTINNALTDSTCTISGHVL